MKSLNHAQKDELNHEIQQAQHDQTSLLQLIKLNH